MSVTYYRSVDGITDSGTHHVPGDVFPESPALAAHFKETGGKQDDRVLYVKLSAKEAREYETGNSPDVEEPVSAEAEVTAEDTADGDDSQV